MLEYQKQIIDIENYKYYQHAIDVFFYPAERLNLKLEADLQELQSKLAEDSKTSPPFVNTPISEYSDRFTEILDYYVNEGKLLGRPYNHIGKRQIKNSLEIILIMESVRNGATETIIEKQGTDELMKSLEKAQKLVTENVRLSKDIMREMAKKMLTINVRLDRDYSKYSLKK